MNLKRILLLPASVLATQIYLSPAATHSSSCSPAEAKSILSNHLRTSRYDSPSLTGFTHDDPFEKQQHAFLILIDDSSNVQDYLPASLSSFHVDGSVSFESWSALVEIYLHRLASMMRIDPSQIPGFASFKHSVQSLGLEHLLEQAWSYAKAPFSHHDDTIRLPVEPKQDYYRFLTQLDLADESAKQMVAEFTEMDNLVERFSKSDAADISSLKLTGLETIRRTHGSASKQYQEAALLFKQMLSATISAYEASQPRGKLIVIVSDENDRRYLGKRAYQDQLLAAFQVSKRQAIAPKNVTVVVPSSKMCYASVDACNNATQSCSGRGGCMPGIQAGKSCFVCHCSKINGTQFSGPSCQSADISSGFYLLGGSVLLLIVIAIASSYLLLAAGQEPLPQILELSQGNHGK